MSRVTVIGTPGFEVDSEAKRWLERCRTDETERAQAIEGALKAVNRVVQAQRVSAQDPYLREVNPGQALTIRIGYGAGDDVVEGHWRAAYTTAPPIPRGRRRRQMLSPQEQVTAILTGRATVGAGDDLLLRARLDLEQDRARQAALQLRVAIDALQAELVEDEGADSESDALAGIRDLHGRASDLAQSALDGDLEESETRAVSQLLEETERTLRRRRHASL